MTNIDAYTDRHIATLVAANLLVDVIVESML